MWAKVPRASSDDQPATDVDGEGVVAPEPDIVACSDGETVPDTKVRKKRRSREEMEALTNASKFVNLTDLLPPLPKKGSFDVGTIKRSEYFFS